MMCAQPSLKVHINQSAVEGEYEFNVFVTTKGKDSTTTSTEVQKERILVVSGIPVITLSNVSIGSVAPGSTMKL